jgi:hypothetical protein
MKALLNLVMVCNLLLLNNIVLAQRKMSFARNAPGFYYCMNNMSSQVKQFQQQNNIGEVKLIGGADISKGSILNLNKETLSSAITKAFPDAQMQGIGALDWEGSELKTLRAGAQNSPAFANAMSRMKEVLAFAQQLRPNVSWGFYGLPFREFWKRNSEWKDNGNKLGDLLNQQDILFPSVYLLFEDNPSSSVSNKDYVKSNVEQALTLGAKYNKPVLPFIWNRYTNYKQVAVDDLKKQVDAILSANVNGQRVVGVVWWNADYYFYTSGNQTFKAEVSNGVNYKDYYDNMILNYSKALLNEVHNYH